MQVDLTHLRVILARPQGFCAGVVRAVDMVERALSLYGAPVYVRHQIVHNRHVVQRLERLGAVFVEKIDDIPSGAVTLFSAHGVARKVETEASVRGLDVIDATCPLVRRVHREAQNYARLGYDIVLVGHEGHAEVEGTRGQVDAPVHVVETVADVEALQVRDRERVAFVTQTTLSVLDTAHIVTALRARFPAIVGPDTKDICYATQNRQMAAIELARQCQIVLVVGSANSSNAARLSEIAAGAGVESHLIDGADALDQAWFEHRRIAGITAGASTPQHVVNDVVLRLAQWRNLSIEDLSGKVENVHFRLPERLMATPAFRRQMAMQTG